MLYLSNNDLLYYNQLKIYPSGILYTSIFKNRCSLNVSAFTAFFRIITNYLFHNRGTNV